jgi:hypothetical protein
MNKRSATIHLEPSFSGWLQNNVGLEYRMVHPSIKDPIWSPYTKDFNIRMDYLPPGENLLQLRAIKNNRVVDEIELSLKVPRTSYESPWFWILFFGGLSLISFLLSRRFNRQRLQLKQAEVELSEQRRQKEQFQVRAIANSLNPHFIKNTLNWIQTRFRKDDTVVDIIDRLSQNISTVFTHSRNGEVFHSLSDEITLVENYITIQQATYGKFFSLSMPSQEMID